MYTLKLNLTKKEYSDFLKSAQKENFATVEEYITKVLHSNVKVKIFITKAVKNIFKFKKTLAQVFR